eukprot:609359-Rhodomonas_salina.2
MSEGGCVAGAPQMPFVCAGCSRAVTTLIRHADPFPAQHHNGMIMLFWRCWRSQVGFMARIPPSCVRFDRDVVQTTSFSPQRH